MCSKVIRISWWLLLVILLAGLQTACSTGPRLHGQAQEIERIAERLHPNESHLGRAYRCAPKEIALARAHHDFGIYELERGNFVHARRHLRLAEENVLRAEQLSSYESCRTDDARVDVVVVASAEITDAPTTFMWDSDGDGIPDHLDKCPFEPAVFIGFGQNDGCPDYDVDGDGVPNILDHCPFIPGNIDGFEGENGCPNLDLDGDGVLNINDQCPRDAVEFIGYEDATGCPNFDVDGDGVPNILDECPFETGTLENAGCPEKLAEITEDQIVLNQQVHFAFDKSDILPQSYPLLNEVANILIEHPHISVRIEGHTDSRGSASYNRKLSHERASSVTQYLIERGIESYRLEAIGFGQDRPIDDNSTDEGRAANRRVEIHITSQ